MAPLTNAFAAAYFFFEATASHGFVESKYGVSRPHPSSLVLLAEKGPEKYRNVATEFLSNFMQSPSDAPPSMSPSQSLTTPADIDFDAPKQPIPDLELLAATLDYELTQREWFVTGNVNPAFFADDFEFQDPDVSLKGIQEYAEGVNKLFNQETSRAEIIETVVNPTLGDNVITCTWRLSGKVDIGPGLTIKPYIVYTDFSVDKSGLIVGQEDRFSLPQWDILLSALFPFLIGKVTKPPAPPVEPREVPKPRIISGKKDASPFSVLTSLFDGMT